MCGCGFRKRPVPPGSHDQQRTVVPRFEASVEKKGHWLRPEFYRVRNSPDDRSTLCSPVADDERESAGVELEVKGEGGSVHN